MKQALLSLAALAGLLYLAVEKRPAPPVSAAGPRRAGFLIRFGSDQIGGDGWTCATRLQRYWDTPYESRMRPTSNRDKVTGKGILVEFDAGGYDIQVRTAQGNFSFPADAEAWSAPLPRLNGRVEVRAAPVSAVLTPGPEADDYPSLLEARDGTLWLAYQSWAGGSDQILVRRRPPGGEWSKPEKLDGGGDYFRTAVAQDRAGWIWVVWSAQVKGNFDLYARAFDGRRWRAAERLTTAPGSDIHHALASDRAGNLYLVYQSSRAGNFDIYARIYDGKRWSTELPVSADPANEWEPALAAAPDGRVTVLWDTYASGSYDVLSRTWENGKLGPVVPIASSGAFEARASAQYDSLGRLWIAWEEGDFNWGKDYGNLIPESGRGLLVRRQARVAVLVNGRRMEPVAPIAEAVPEDLRQVFHQPRLVLDPKGVPWLFVRYRINLPQGQMGESSRALWRLGATCYRGGRWLPLIEFPEGHGRIDAPVAAAAGRDGNLHVAWVSDGRLWPSGTPRDQDLYIARIPAASGSLEPELSGFVPPAENPAASHAREAEDVARMRDYRARTGAQVFRIARGDIHRHTDISWDGNRDGSLDDAYRYALDAASLDFLGVCDHQAGQSIPYNWFRIQKAVDLFTIQGKFAPLYSYERSLPFPDGHRNVLFAQRGHPIL
ncbi:MAG: hypothetical protein HYR60_12525, partial [Acidobacteria bacterium]|nr:hypothetical protein [Acidobacteriota bacterium]